MNDQLNIAQHIRVSSRSIVAMSHYFSKSKTDKKRAVSFKWFERKKKVRLKKIIVFWTENFRKLPVYFKGHKKSQPKSFA